MIVHDISVRLLPGMPTYPGEPGPVLTPINSLDAGDEANVTSFSMGSHTGTHVDAPLHFLRGGPAVDDLRLDDLVGEAWVMDVTGPADISAETLEKASIPSTAERLLFKTQNGRLWDLPAFQTDFVALTADAAEWLVRRGVRLVGIDYLSIEAFGAAPHAAHRALLSAAVVVLEGLDLRGVTPGSYLLACLPLKLAGAEGAPARAVLMQI